VDRRSLCPGIFPTVSIGTSFSQGSGLGLLLTKDFIKANHGRIWLESEQGKGTTFFVAMPAV
jgi:two-component system sensor histidine kinase/response regulator